MILRHESTPALSRKLKLLPSRAASSVFFFFVSSLFAAAVGNCKEMLAGTGSSSGLLCLDFGVGSEGDGLFLGS